MGPGLDVLYITSAHIPLSTWPHRTAEEGGTYSLLCSQETHVENMGFSEQPAVSTTVCVYQSMAIVIDRTRHILFKG